VTAVFLNARTVFHLKASIGCLLLTHVNKGSVLRTLPRGLVLSAASPRRNGNREKCARRNAHTDPTCPPYRARRKESRSDWQPC
ncbi:hypothetical protein KUCAC02_032244, partial [Chaenocephalus aceratus]